MHRTPRIVPALALAVASLLVVSCGVEERKADGPATTAKGLDPQTTVTVGAETSTTDRDVETTEPDETTTTDADETTTTGGTDDTTPIEDSFKKEMIDLYVSMGATPEQAECIYEKSSSGSFETDPFTECGFDILSGMGD